MMGVAFAHRRLEHFDAGSTSLRLRAGEGLAQDSLGEVALAVRHQLGRKATAESGRRGGPDTWSCGRWSGDAASLLLALLLGGLRSVLGAALLTVADPGGVEGATNDVGT